MNLSYKYKNKHKEIKMSNIPFRVSDGLDGANKRAINIGYPTITSMNDAVNVQFFIDQNTVQQFDSKRKYPKGFAVIYNDRLYYSLREIAIGNFVEEYWQLVRIDPKWTNINTSLSTGRDLVPGDFINTDSTYSEILLNLPETAENGSTIVVKETSGKVATMRVKIVAKTAMDNGETEVTVTRPKSMIWFTYDNAINIGKGGWRVLFLNPAINGLVVKSGQDIQLSNGEDIFRKSSTGTMSFILPKYANDGDKIELTDGEQMTSINNMTIKSHPDSTATIQNKTNKSLVIKTNGRITLIYSKEDNVWGVFDSDDYEKWIRIPTSATALDNTLHVGTKVLITGDSGATNLNFPLTPATGETIEVSLRNIPKGITIKFTGKNKLKFNAAMLGMMEKYNTTAYSAMPLVDSVTYVSKGRGELFKFAYFADTNCWMLVDSSAINNIAAPDASIRSEPGISFFATETEVLKNSEDAPSDASIVTPLTLSKKVATEARRGISSIANQTEVNAGTDDVKFLTSKKLNEKTALETRRGVVAIATQAETNAGTDDTKTITPKKLAGRNATESMTGIASLVKQGSTEQTSRTAKGTGINDFDNHTQIVTPKVLFEKKASELTLGMMYWATQSEVNAGSAGNVVVRPETLNARTALTNRTGLARLATQAEVIAGTEATSIVTPQTLQGKKASYTAFGITRSAVQEEMLAGTEESIFISPLKLKEAFKVAVKLTTPESDGLSYTGNLWDGATLQIEAASTTRRGTLRLATQEETNGANNDWAAVTPKMLNARNATISLTGLIRLASDVESVAGTVTNAALTPIHLKTIMQNTASWGSTTVLRGPILNSVLTNDNAATTVWQGNTTAGSTRAVASYVHDGYAVSPRGLNTALANYLPKTAKAYDVGLFDGLKSTEFMRSNQDTSTTGDLTATGTINSATGLFTNGNAKGSFNSTKNPQGSLIQWNTTSGQGRMDLISLSGSGSGGFDFWIGKTFDTKTLAATINSAGTLIATGASLSGPLTANAITVANSGEINYKAQTLDARFVNTAGDTGLGSMTFVAASKLTFARDTNDTGVLNSAIDAQAGNGDVGYLGVGGVSGMGFLELGTKQGSGNGPIYIRQRKGAANDGNITRSVTVLDTSGNTYFPGIVSMNVLNLEATTVQNPIVYKRGTVTGVVASNGDISGSIWGATGTTGTFLSTYLNKKFAEVIKETGGTITGDMTVNKNLMVEGVLKIKAGTKYLVIRPDPITESVLFEWENV